MQRENTKGTFFGDLWEIAKEAARTLFGEAAPTPTQTPAPALAVIKTAPPVAPIVRPIPKREEIDLTGDDEPKEVEIIQDSVEPATKEKPIEFADDTSEKIRLDEALAKQKTALTFQYFNQLNVANNDGKQAKLVKLKAKGKNQSYELQSTAYAKYHSADKKLALQNLISMMTDIGAEPAQRLLSGAWLGDSEINYFLKLAVSQNPEVFLIDTLAASVPGYLNKLRTSPSYLKENGIVQQMKEAQRILWPICKDSHWHLAVMDKNIDNSYQISCLDSLGYNDPEVIEKAKNVLQALYPNMEMQTLVSDDNVRHISIPKQNNMRDCGVAACYWGNQIIRNKVLPSEMKGLCDYSQYRFDIAEALADDFTKDLKKANVAENDVPAASKSVKILDVWKRKNKL